MTTGIGTHYSNYLTVDDDRTKQGTRVTKVTKKNGYYLFHMFNNYITLYYGKLTVNDDGTAKAVIKVDKNYHPKFQYTLYFDELGREINRGSTRKEMLIYKKIRESLKK